MAHAVVRTDKMFGTDNRTGLVSVKFGFVSGNDMVWNSIDNGCVAKVVKLIDGEREIYEAVAPSKDDDLKDIVLIATPEMGYCPCKYAITEFTNEIGAVSRGYFLTPHSIFSVTIDALTGLGTPAVGNIIELNDGVNLKVVSTATAGSTQVGKIIAVETVGSLTFYVIEVG